MKDSKSGHVLPRKNSSLMWPSTCSAAPSSMQFPLRDMLWVISAFLRRRVRLLCWYCQPMSALSRHRLSADQGAQYTSRSFQRCLGSHGIIQSVSRPGTPLDNAVAESLFKTL